MTRPLSTPDVFKALADPTRRQILLMLAESEMKVSEIFEAVKISQPACSQHLRILREINLVSQHRESSTRIYRLNATPLEEVNIFTSKFEKFWSQTLDRLENLMDNED
jgi:DNA-binding transcriptional ArsR family regulator